MQLMYRGHFYFPKFRGRFFHGKKYLIHDRDPLYNTTGFHNIFCSSCIKTIKLPSRSPDLNCYAERFVKSIKSECLDHLILSSVEQLDYVLKQYSQYYHHERIYLLVMDKFLYLKPVSYLFTRLY